MDVNERAFACLQALATGDAIGKQTENLTRADILHWYPGGIRGFHSSPGEVIPRYALDRKRKWRVGETTDDTEQTIAVARAILRDQCVRHTSVGKELLQCEKSVHPGVKSMWTFKQSGDPGRVATDGDGCGAAMRVSPVGILYSSSRVNDLVNGAYEASIPTHGGQLAISAAAAVALGISVALDGGPAQEVLDSSVQAASMIEERMGSALRNIYDDLSNRKDLNVDEISRTHFPDRPLTKVPLAIALAVITESAQDLILLAANIGGDADSVASIGAAIAAALRPATVNPDWFNVVELVNNHDLRNIASSLAALRT